MKHLVLITARVKPGKVGQALKRFKKMRPTIKRIAKGFSRSIFFHSIEEPDKVGCVCIWASREAFLAAADDPVYQKTVTDYFAAPIFTEAPTHTAFDVLFESE